MNVYILYRGNVIDVSLFNFIFYRINYVFKLGAQFYGVLVLFCFLPTVKKIISVYKIPHKEFRKIYSSALHP